ncbi:NB-ARC domain-containing protein [Nonomuraea angiospora]|uniref:WD40 repeat protein n=1 Tax=Nonomuraea angiospora TaxID=46172 RepID=A0ABR9LRL8_9ACTN|nr:NB-ARC domain-containing protein [Nonomuraea angiospora]MBE1582910.1 WD40 repeat protein [Nonomuraea angiospora]
MARRRTLAPALVTALLVVLGIVIGLPVNVVSDYLPDHVTANRPAWIAGLAGAVVLIVALTLLLPTLSERRARVPSFRVPPRDPEWVNRRELAMIMAALRRGSAPVGLTAGIVGAGGFGKTSLAAEICHRREARRRFKGGIVWVTLGRDRSGAELASLINDVVAHLDGERPEFGDPEQAGHRLVEVLDGRRPVLLVIDDVWSAAQLAPFLPAAAHAQLLVTTRRPSIVRGTTIEVDEMSPQAATRLLTRDLPDVRADLVRDLLRATGRWPLLLAVVNARLRKQRARGADVDRAAEEALQRLRANGPAAFDLTVTDERAQAVRATVDYSLDLLTGEERARFADLGVLPEDTDVPVDAVALLWGCPKPEAERLCEKLHELALLALHWAAGSMAVVTLHDVIRGYLRSAAGSTALVMAGRRLITRARALAPGGWWNLPPGEPYLWDNLAFHLKEAGLRDEVNDLVSDVRWLVPRTARSGPAAAVADLAHASSPPARQIAGMLSGFGHLLTSSSDLLTRLSAVPGRQAPVASYAEQAGVSFLPARRPLPEGDSANLRRLLPGHPKGVAALAIAPDGSWLASGESSGPKSNANYSDAVGVVRLWNSDGDLQAVLDGHPGGVSALAIAPDSTFLVTGDGNGFDVISMEHGVGAARLWTPEGDRIASLDGHHDMVTAIAIAPDSGWLATGDHSPTVRIWSRRGRLLATYDGATFGWISALAISPDGTWLAAGSGSRVTILDPGGIPIAFLDHPSDGEVTTLVISPDGSWLAMGDDRGAVRVLDSRFTALSGAFAFDSRCRCLAISPDSSWLVAGSDAGQIHIQDRNGHVRNAIDGHDAAVTALAIAPDGTWLASGDATGEVRLWQSDGSPRARLSGHTGWLSGLAIASDGTWLASASSGNSAARLWDSAPDVLVETPHETGPVTALAAAANGSWFVVGDDRGRVRVWDADGSRRAEVSVVPTRVSAIAVAPDGAWFATAPSFEDVRLWNAHGEPRARLSGSDGTSALAIAPDGSWLVTGGGRGEVRLWGCGGEPRRTMTIPHVEEWILALAIAPDGTWFATAAGNRIQIWDADGTFRFDRYCSPLWRVSALTIPPDGTWLATGDGRQVVVWDRAGEQRSTFGGSPDGGPIKMAISPDGARLATGDVDGVVRVWDPDGHEQGRPSAHRGRVGAVAFSPDGAWLATGGQDGIIKLWNGSDEVTFQTAERITSLAWLADASTLCAAGPQGLYVLDRPHPAAARATPPVIG